MPLLTIIQGWSFSFIISVICRIGFNPRADVRSLIYFFFYLGVLDKGSWRFVEGEVKQKLCCLLCENSVTSGKTSLWRHLARGVLSKELHITSSCLSERLTSTFPPIPFSLETFYGLQLTSAEWSGVMGSPLLTVQGLWVILKKKAWEK